jgi:hypothetical protein
MWWPRPRPPVWNAAVSNYKTSHLPYGAVSLNNATTLD